MDVFKRFSCTAHTSNTSGSISIGYALLFGEKGDFTARDGNKEAMESGVDNDRALAMVSSFFITTTRA